jgi:hypothetical protein
MPYVFECPVCRENNYGLRTPPTSAPDGSITFFNDLKCSRCGATGLYWVANDSAAQLLGRQSPPVPRNRIAVGVSQSDIGWFDPDGRAEIQKEVLNLMRGVATLSASFNQGQRQQALLPQRLDVAEGLCEGMSLHWIRRVLQGGKTTFTVDKTKDGIDRSDAVRLARLKRQLTVGANVQVTDVPSAWNDRLLTSLGFTHRGGSSWSIPANLQSLWDETQAKGKYAKHWENLSREYDRQLNADGRRSARTFSNLVCISSTTRSQRPLADFAASLCRDTSFRPGTAALLSVGLRIGVGEAGGSISGHAIAAYCRSATEQFLFDPNIGVWVCTTRANLQRAIELLIGTGWTTRMQWVLEGTYGYSLFQARATAASVQARERPVVMTPSPQSTAIQNQAVMPPVMRPQPGGTGGAGGSRPSTTPIRSSPNVTRPATPSVTSTPSHPPSRPTEPTGGTLPGGGGRVRPQGSPQTVSTTPRPTAGGPRQQLKAQLEQVRDDPGRQIAGAFGSHGTVQGGWVKVPYTLVQKLRAERVTTSDPVKMGGQGEYAIARSHVIQLIGML